MKNFDQKDIKSLFSQLCCSKCRNDFTFDSISIKEKCGSILICKLKCIKCGADFGDIVFNIDKKFKYHQPLEIIDGPPPISTDDVLDAHKFIKNMK